jgi:hypothetical protein
VILRMLVVKHADHNCAGTALVPMLRCPLGVSFRCRATVPARGARRRWNQCAACWAP